MITLDILHWDIAAMACVLLRVSQLRIGTLSLPHYFYIIMRRSDTDINYVQGFGCHES
jgi:hypothetical protein